MASRKVGGIVAELMLNDKDFRDKMNRASKLTSSKTAEMAKQFKTLARTIGPLLGVAGFAGVANSAMNAADAIQKGAKRTGLLNDEFQRLKYAVERGGGSFSAMETALKELNNEIGLGGEKLAKYGIASTNADGSQRKLRDVLGDVSTRLRDAATQADRVAMAKDLMRTAGVDLLPVLQDGDEAIRAMGEGAKVMADDTIESLNRAKDKWGDYKDHVVIQTAEIMGKMEKLGKALGEGAAGLAFGGISTEEFDEKFAREQARKQLRAEGILKTRGGIADAAPSGNPFEGDKLVEERAQQILARNARRQLEGEKAMQQAMEKADALADEVKKTNAVTAAEEDHAAVLDEVREKIEAINRATKERVAFEGMQDDQKLAALQKRMEELQGIQGNTSASPEDRLKAAKELQQKELEHFRIQDRIARALEDASFDLGDAAEDLETIVGKMTTADIARLGGNTQNARMARQAMALQDKADRMEAGANEGFADKLRERAEKIEGKLKRRGDPDTEAERMRLAAQQDPEGRTAEGRAALMDLTRRGELSSNANERQRQLMEMQMATPAREVDTASRVERDGGGDDGLREDLRELIQALSELPTKIGVS